MWLLWGFKGESYDLNRQILKIIEIKAYYIVKSTFSTCSVEPV